MLLNVKNRLYQNRNTVNNLHFGKRNTSITKQTEAGNGANEYIKTPKPSKYLQFKINKEKAKLEKKLGKKYDEITPQEFLKIFKIEFETDSTDGKLIVTSGVNLPNNKLSKILLQDPDFPIQKILTSIKKVEKVISIKSCNALTNLGGIRKIAGNLKITDCPNFSSLGNVEIVRKGIELNNLPMLENLGNLSKVFTNIKIIKCPKLKSLFPLKRVYGSLELIECNSLKLIGNVARISCGVIIKNCDKLKSIEDINIQESRIGKMSQVIFLEDKSIKKKVLLKLKNVFAK